MPSTKAAFGRRVGRRFTASFQSPRGLFRGIELRHAPYPVLLCLLLVAPLRTSVADQEHWRNVTGASLQTLFQDKEFGDGVHFAYQFKAGGSFTGTEMSKRVSGSWHVRKNEFCWKWLRPPGPQECYQVQQDGAHVRLMINGSEAWYGTLEPVR